MLTQFQSLPVPIIQEFHVNQWEIQNSQQMVFPQQPTAATIVRKRGHTHNTRNCELKGKLVVLKGVLDANQTFHYFHLPERKNYDFIIYMYIYIFPI